MPLKFQPRNKQAHGQRGEGIVTSLDENARRSMLEMFLYIDDGRRGVESCVMARLQRLKEQEEQKGAAGVEAVLVIDEVVDYFRTLYEQAAVCQTILTGLEDYKRQAVS